VDSSSCPKKHVLVISGVPRVLAEIKMELMGSFDVNIAAVSETALAVLEMHDIAVAVICIDENREHAFSIFQDIYDSVQNKNIPVIFLAEKGNDDDETAAFAIGAADYTTRRSGTVNALVNRIRLRISAGEYERRAVKAESAAAASSGNAAPEAVLTGKTILVAEDVELNREIVSCMLSDIDGLTLDMACDGREAVEKFKARPDRYALILMDIHMPEMDGLTATRIIRGLPCDNARDIPVIALTASTDEAEIEKCLDAGMNNFLEKPMSYDKLLVMAADYCL